MINGKYETNKCVEKFVAYNFTSVNMNKMSFEYLKDQYLLEKLILLTKYSTPLEVYDISTYILKRGTFKC
jgi:hypothetical protein